jgi:hypothetical protein
LAYVREGEREANLGTLRRLQELASEPGQRLAYVREREKEAISRTACQSAINNNEDATDVMVQVVTTP